LNSDLCTITKYDAIDIPTALKLYTCEEKDFIDEDLEDPPPIDTDITHDTGPDNVSRTLDPIVESKDDNVTDEILNDPLDKSIQNFQPKTTQQAVYADIQDNVLNSLKDKIDVPKFPDDVNLNPISNTTVTLNFPQQVTKSKDRPSDILDVLYPDSDNDEDDNIDNVPLDDNIQRKVTFSDNLDVQE
jgi:hypothetical protein